MIFKERILFYGVVALFFVIAVLPVLFLMVGSFFDTNGFSLAAYEILFHNKAMLVALKNSFFLAITVAFLTTLIGTFVALLFVKCDFSFGNILLAFFTVPLLIPSYILAFSWASLFGKSFYGVWGVVFVLFWVYLPVSIFIVTLYLRRIDSTLEEAALLVTDGKGVLLGITLPLVREALFFAFVLVFILAFGEFGVANFLRYPVFVTQSFVYFSAFYDFKAAIVASLPVLFVVAAVFWMQRYILQVTTYVHQKRVKGLCFEVGKYRLLFGMFLLFLLAGVVVPLVQLVVEVKTFHLFLEALEQAKTALLHTLGIGVLSATLLMLFGFLSAYLVVYRMVRGWRFFDALVLVLFALPSVVLGIGLILLWNTKATNFIYTTLLILLFAYLGKYLALSMKTIQAHLQKLPSSLHEAAMLCGAKWYQIWRYITIPLSREELLTAWVIGFVFTVRETTMTMLLYPPGMDTLPVYILTQMANGKEEMIAALSLIMVLVTLLPFLFVFVYRKVRIS